MRQPLAVPILQIAKPTRRMSQMQRAVAGGLAVDLFPSDEVEHAGGGIGQLGDQPGPGGLTHLRQHRFRRQPKSRIDQTDIAP